MNRTLITVILFLCTTALLHAQPRERKGYFALNAGPAWLPGKYFDNSIAFQPNLEFGYTISHGWGVSATWLGAAFGYETTNYMSFGPSPPTEVVGVQASYGFLGLGPMYSIRLSPTLSVDLTGRVGSFYYQELARTSTMHSESENTSVGYFVSATCQKRMTEWWSFFGSLDYGNGRKPITMETNQPVNWLALTVGVGVRL